jgi:hypothetical protein
MNDPEEKPRLNYWLFSQCKKKQFILFPQNQYTLLPELSVSKCQLTGTGSFVAAHSSVPAYVIPFHRILS